MRIMLGCAPLPYPLAPMDLRRKLAPTTPRHGYPLR